MFHPDPRPVRQRRGLAVAVLAFAATTAGCMVGPDYVRPGVVTPTAFREMPPADGWKPAQPRDADSSGEPWSAFGDATLDRLMAEAVTANQTIVQADANYRASLASVRLARSALFPTVGLAASDSRTRAGGTGASRGTSFQSDAHSLLLQASWEPDLWGGVRRSIEAAGATAESTEATLAAVRLSIRSQLASNYLQLRVTDETRDLYANSVDVFRRSLQLSQSQFRAGTVSRSDVALATAQLKATQSLLTDTLATRAQLEHAIALLLGRAPADFTLPPAPLEARYPVVPYGVPSDLLERRPDIATAERLAAAANANIGVARAAYYPLATLSASGGDSLAAFGSYFTAPGRVWSLGASLAQTLFDGGARRAADARAVATYDAAVANYRETVLAGFTEVEDNLALLRVLADEQGTDDEAVTASRDAERIALAQYRAGTTTYLAVITAQNTRLANERTVVTLRGRRFAASVALIRAVGGGWNATATDVPLASAASSLSSVPANGSPQTP